MDSDHVENMENSSRATGVGFGVLPDNHYGVVNSFVGKMNRGMRQRGAVSSALSTHLFRVRTQETTGTIGVIIVVLFIRGNDFIITSSLALTEALPRETMEPNPLLGSLRYEASIQVLIDRLPNF